MKVGIIGMGFVGEAMHESFSKRGVGTILSYDKYKGIGAGVEELLDTDMVFLCLPTPYVEGFGYDLSPIKENLRKLRDLNYSNPIVIKSTVEPGATRKLMEEFGFHYNLIHNPEFLTARTANEDFDNQKHIVIGHIANEKISPYAAHRVQKFYEKLYPEAKISSCTSEESESMKIMVNSFYAAKVQIFNEFFFLCQRVGADYDKVKELMLENGWINPMHTSVPGPDGGFSYSGACFPKDTSALNHLMEILGTPNEVLDACIKERAKIRKD